MFIFKMNQKRPSKFELSEEEIRKKIVLDFKQGHEIVDIARDHNYHIKSIKRIIRTFSKRKSFKRRKGAGRPQKLNQSHKMTSRNMIRSHPWTTCSEISKRLAIRNYLKFLGYSYKRPSKKLQLTQQDKEVRYTWAINHKNFDFSNVVFADEASFWLHGQAAKM